MNSQYLRMCLVGFILIGMTGCGPYSRVVLEDDDGYVEVEIDQGPPVDYPPPRRDRRRDRDYDRDYRGRPGRGHYESRIPRIPPGHMPPPGECRIWYPDRPPGDQPPPGNCRELRRQLPPGAWLIR